MSFRTFLENVNQEMGFYISCFHNPYDNTPFLVFADWLEEHNNPLGTFTRGICQRLENKKGTLKRLNDQIKSFYNFYKNQRQFMILNTRNPNDGQPVIEFMPLIRKIPRINYEWFSERYTTSFHRSGKMPEDQWRDLDIPANTLVMDRYDVRYIDWPEPHYYRPHGNAQFNTVDENSPDHPKNWDFPYYGMKINYDLTMLKNIYLALLLNKIPRHLKN